MSELAFLRSVRRLFASSGARASRGSALVALCLVALQLATALHFALVPHGFNAGLSGFVHVHEAAARAAQSSALGVPRRASEAPAFEAGGASCAAESCPIGFAGHHSVLLGESQASGVIALAGAAQLGPGAPHFAAPSRVLSSAPKTSPPV